jgi:hypothetical protein
MGMERRLVAAAVYHKGDAHDRQFVERTWHGRITQGADGQHARAFFTPSEILRSLEASAAGGRGVSTRITRWPPCCHAPSQDI